MTPSRARARRSGVVWLALSTAFALSCSAPYDNEAHFWPLDEGAGAGSSFPSDTGGGGGAAAAPSTAGSGTGGSGSTSGGATGASGAVGETMDGAGRGGGGNGGSGSGSGNLAGSAGSLGGSTSSGGSGGAPGGSGAGTAGGGGSSQGGSASGGGSAGGAGGGGSAGSPGAGGGTSSANCSLSVKVTTAAAGGKYAPRNIGAIWVADQSGKFIRSLEVWAQRRANHLTQWNAATSKAGAAGSRVDIVSQATLTSHRAHTATWNCQDFKKLPVPDGTYRVYFEMSDASNNGPNRFETFTKGPAAATLNPADNNNFKAIELSFKP